LGTFEADAGIPATDELLLVLLFAVGVVVCAEVLGRAAKAAPVDSRETLA